MIAASKEALAEAVKAEEAKHVKWLAAEEAGRAADKYAAEKFKKVEELWRGKFEALCVKAQVQSCHLACSWEDSILRFCQRDMMMSWKSFKIHSLCNRA